MGLVDSNTVIQGAFDCNKGKYASSDFTGGTDHLPETLEARLVAAGELIARAQDLAGSTALEELTLAKGILGLEVTELSRAGQCGKPQDRLLSLLDGTFSSPSVEAPALRDLLSVIVANSYDAKLARKGGKQVSLKLRERYERRKNSQHDFLVSLVTRMRGKHATPPAIIRRSLELKFYATHERVWRLQCQQRTAMSESWVDGLLDNPAVRARRPPTPEEWSSDIEMHVRDNLEWYLKIKFNRHQGGKLLTSEIKHTVTGELFYTPASLTRDLVSPDLGDRCHVSFRG